MYFNPLITVSLLPLKRSLLARMLLASQKRKRKGILKSIVKALSPHLKLLYWSSSGSNHPTRLDGEHICSGSLFVTNLRMIGLLLAVLGLFAVIVIGSLVTVDLSVRHDVIGFLSCASLISMFASPLLIINLVIRTRSVEFMPFYLSLSTFFMSTSLLYGIFNSEPFVFVSFRANIHLLVFYLLSYFTLMMNATSCKATGLKKTCVFDLQTPNGVGTILGIVQLVLYCYIKNIEREDSREPFIVSFHE